MAEVDEGVQGVVSSVGMCAERPLQGTKGLSKEEAKSIVEPDRAWQITSEAALTFRTGEYYLRKYSTLPQSAIYRVVCFQFAV